METPTLPPEEFPEIPVELAKFRPEAALVLGSGLGGFAETCEELFEVSYDEIPGLPSSKVPGHAGKFVGAELSGIPLLLAVGRVHYYEGLSARAVASHVRLMASLGIKNLLLTNAAGSVNPSYAPGNWMMLNDHINFTGASPLRGGPHFADMSHVYDKSLRGFFRSLALEQGMNLLEGIYACMPGPQYETPAEVRMLRTMGVDAVGMSTVFEAIQARAVGLRVGAFSCLTNWAAGMSDGPLSHIEVIETGRAAATTLSNLLAAALRRGLPGA